LNQNYVIDGIRNPGEIEVLKNSDANFYLISVDASQNTRYSRVRYRNKSSDPNDWRGFLEMDKRDFGEKDSLGQQVEECMKLADFMIINDSNINEFHKKIENIYKKII